MAVPQDKLDLDKIKQRVKDEFNYQVVEDAIVERLRTKLEEKIRDEIIKEQMDDLETELKKVI